MKRLLPFVIGFIIVTSVFAAAPGQDFAVLKTKNQNSRIVARNTLQFSFLFPELAGTLRLGVISANLSRWAEQMKSTSFKTHKSISAYEIKDSMLGSGTLRITAVALSSTDGLILEIEPLNIPEGIELFWVCGGASGKPIAEADACLKPEWCKDNVFVMERNDLTIFYGESMNLKTLNYLFPVQSESVLSDAHQQVSPISFFQSGKKTDAPALTGRFKLISGEKFYICIYRQTRDADYNYSHLKELFKAILN